MSYRSNRNNKYAGLLLAFLIILNSSSLLAANVTLSWDPPVSNSNGTPLTDLSGYKVHFGTAAGNYTQSIDAGNMTTYTINNLSGGATYYFAVIAYDIFGHESNFSNETVETVAIVFYYCDKDQDGYINATLNGKCDGLGCQPAGCQTLAGSDCNDNNATISPNGNDSNCNGIDENCSGAADEGYSPTATNCGTGACSAAGQNVCQGGAIVNTCTAGNPTGDDSDCNGIDNNCDGTPDNNYVTAVTSCGTGVCTSIGKTECIGGNEVNTCLPGAPTENPEVTCNDNLDNDCDGRADAGCTPVINVRKVLLAEDFAYGIQGTWSANGGWSADNTCGKAIDNPFVPPSAIVDSTCTNTGIAELVTPAFDTGFCSNAKLSFSNQYQQNNGYVEIDTSDDGGANWMNSLLMAADDGYPVPDWKDIDISNIADTQSAKIKFKYSNSAGGYWAIDNLLASCQPAQMVFSSDLRIPSQAQTIMITNTGSGSLMISNIGIDGTDLSDFIIDANRDTCSNKTLLPSEACTVDVVFLPASTGTKSANFFIPSSDPVTPLLTIPLSGTVSGIINPKPVIKANGATGYLNVIKGSVVTVTIELDPGSYQNQDGDWWVVLAASGGKFYYNASTNNWSKGYSPYFQGPLIHQGTVVVSSKSIMTAGQYKFSFGVDTNMNGVLDAKESFYDGITVDVK